VNSTNQSGVRCGQRINRDVDKLPKSLSVLKGAKMLVLVIGAVAVTVRCNFLGTVPGTWQSQSKGGQWFVTDVSCDPEAGLTGFIHYPSDPHAVSRWKPRELRGHFREDLTPPTLSK